MTASSAFPTTPTSTVVRITGPRSSSRSRAVCRAEIVDDERGRRATRGHSPVWEETPARKLREPIGQRVLVSVGEEEPAHSRLNGLGEAADRARDHRHAADDRLERRQAERLGPRRWRDERPRSDELGLDLLARNRADELHRRLEPQRASESFEPGALGPIAHDAQGRGELAARRRPNARSRTSTPFSRLSRPVKRKSGSAAGARAKSAARRLDRPGKPIGVDPFPRELRAHEATAGDDRIGALDRGPDQRVAGLLSQPARR